MIDVEPSSAKDLNLASTMSSRHFLRLARPSLTSISHPHSKFLPGNTFYYSTDIETSIVAGVYDDEKYPKGEFIYRPPTSWGAFLLKMKILFAPPGQRFRSGSVLEIYLRGRITDQLPTGFDNALSLPQLCESFEKAAYDPRILGIYLHIETLICGWGKLDEIHRCILEFKKSGKFIIGYAPICGMKEYYIACVCDELYIPPSAYVGLYGVLVNASFFGAALEKAGIEPHVERIGKYKSFGDQFTRRSMSDENREMLTALLDNIYRNWVDKVSLAKGKEKEEVENFINEGVYKVTTLKEEGWITEVKYYDEVISMLRKRIRIKENKNLPIVAYRKYKSVWKWTLGLKGSEEKIAVIRASGSISRTQGSFSIPDSSIVAEKFIEKIQKAKDSKEYKAVIIRIDSPGGDALASDMMWREIKRLSATKPVIASMADVAASGGYYMAMAANVVVAERLTLTGSIGVVSAKLTLGKLYEYIGFNKEIISRGRYAELAAEQRSPREDEAELFAKRAEEMYKQFRDKAALSRSMAVDKMEQAAQGRVWTGHDAASLGLVDAIGGFSRAVAIAKQKANIAPDKKVTLVELSGGSGLPFPLRIVRKLGMSAVGRDGSVKELLHEAVDGSVKEFLDEMTRSDEIQARMDGILYENLDGDPHINSVFTLLKDCLRSL